MIKIFSKLNHILTITIIFITLLFSILIYHQYSQFEDSKSTLNKETILSLNKDITLILDFYHNLANIYYDESFKNNLSLIDNLYYYNTPKDNTNISDLDFEAILSPSFQSAQNSNFSYIKLFDKSSNLITTMSDSKTIKDTHYSFQYPLYKESELIGYIELGLSVNSIIKTLEETTFQATYAIFQKTKLSKNTLVNYSQDYTTSNLSDQYYEDLELMKELNAYTNNYEKEIFDEFTHILSSSINEDLLNYNNFIINQSFNKKYYSLTFITLDHTSNRENGYFVLFNQNTDLTVLHDNLISSLVLLFVLYLILLFIVAFIYYILHHLYHFSYTDHLTKAYNRHKFFEVIKHNIYDYHRYNYMFSIILIDIDNFKDINDTLGHKTGDDLLIEFVAILQNTLRTTDYLFRWDGEEFLVLLSHCDGLLGYQVAEKLRQTISTNDFGLKNDLNLTASLGVATYKNSATVELMLSHSDQALRISKSKGKNCTTLYAPDLN